MKKSVSFMYVCVAENAELLVFLRQNYTLAEQKAILLILISIIDKNINFSSK